MYSEHMKLEKSFSDLAAELSRLGQSDRDPVYREAELYLQTAYQALHDKTRRLTKPLAE